MHTPLPLPMIEDPTETFDRVMLPGLINPRSESMNPVIPNLVSSKTLDSVIHPSPISMIQHRMPNHTNGAMPSFHGPLMHLSKGSVHFSKGESSSEEESESEKKVYRELARATSKSQAKKARKARGAKHMSIKDHAGAGQE